MAYIMKICFVHAGLSTFVKRDLEILQEQYTVRECYFRGLRSAFKLLQLVFWSDVTFTWFGALPAFFAVLYSKILGKKSVVVAGGYDVAKVPEINYGLFASAWKKYFPLFTFRYTDSIICVSESNRQETIMNAKASPNKINRIYHGFSSDYYSALEGTYKEDIILTVGQINMDTLNIKGLDIFVESAHYLPDRLFYLVGPWEDEAIDYLKNKAPKNVSFLSKIYGKDLVSIYSKAKVYVQASLHESFGCALAEAMLCECIPVVTSNYAIPEVVGNCGLYININDPQELAKMIEKAFHTDLGKSARKRIIEHFPLEKHKKELLEAMDKINR